MESVEHRSNFVLLNATVFIYQCASARIYKMVYSEYTKLRILLYHFKGLKAPTIARYLEAENIDCARQNVGIFIKKYCQTKSICLRSGSGRP